MLEEDAVLCLEIFKIKSVLPQLQRITELYSIEFPSINIRVQTGAPYHVSKV